MSISVLFCYIAGADDGRKMLFIAGRQFAEQSECASRRTVDKPPILMDKSKR